MSLSKLSEQTNPTMQTVTAEQQQWGGVSELSKLDGAELREAVRPALERLVVRGKAGASWSEVVRRVAQVSATLVGAHRCSSCAAASSPATLNPSSC